MKNSIPLILEIPKDEEKEFEKLIKQYRKQYIRNSKDIVKQVLDEHKYFIEEIENKSISKIILGIRELAWNEYLKDEVEFNVVLMKNLHLVLETPKRIIEAIVDNKVINYSGEELIREVRDICGEYAGRVYPYIYKISLSNTNSRRSRSGSTFEAIIYTVYEALGYPYDSQSKVGRKIFTELGLGKKVDSILPNVGCFEKRRNKTIIGTMKTSLRERWQEVAEEIERTKIPEIHLLTVDENISYNKASEMSKHNIIVVAFDWVANSKPLKEMRNIISFEEYFFEEIPLILKFWDE
ncbi:MAG: type II restriction endonuclease [Bacteroidetes bacterium]|nr:MAG: type II restriction endonuclease [Bacteroidota bacterium]